MKSDVLEGKSKMSTSPSHPFMYIGLSDYLRPMTFNICMSRRGHLTLCIIIFYYLVVKLAVNYSYCTLLTACGDEVRTFLVVCVLHQRG